MPVHDWARVDAGLFQDFRSGWITQLSRVFNQGALPDDYYAMLQPAALSVEEIIAPPGELPFREPWREQAADEMEFYRLRKSHIVVRRAEDHSAAGVLDILSAGDKARASAVAIIVNRIVGLIRRGIHVLLVDVLPAGLCDPFGVHTAIWEEIVQERPTMRSEKPLVLASWEAEPEKLSCYVEPIAVGDLLPDMPIFLKPQYYVSHSRPHTKACGARFRMF